LQESVKMISRNSLLLSVLITALCSLALGLVFHKVFVLKLPVTPGEKQSEIMLEARIKYEAKSEPVRVKLMLPDHLREVALLNESASVGYGFHTKSSPGVWNATWSARNKVGHERLYYKLKLPASADTFQEFQASPNAEIPSPVLPSFSATSLIAQATFTLLNTAAEQSADLQGLVEEVVRESFSEAPSQEFAIMKRYYEQRHDEDWMVHLLAELLGLEEVATRIGLGLVYDPEVPVQKPRQVKVVEYLDGQTWRTVDLYANKTENQPREKLFVWKRGQQQVLSVKGGNEQELEFVMEIQRSPAVEGFENHSLLFSTLASLPHTERAVFRYVTLIPLGIVMVIFFRNIIGLSSLGTFMPVLLALAFLEMKAVSGLIAFLGILIVGLLFRSKLSHLNLLIVPRVGACVVIVTILMILASVFSYQFGFSRGLQITVFPMIVLAWTIERVSILWEEEGPKMAIKQIIGSVIMSLATYLTMRQELVQFWLFYYPETLLILLAITLFIGRYFGYRVLELFRFEKLVG